MAVRVLSLPMARCHDKYMKVETIKPATSFLSWKCDNHYHNDNTPVVALSTGWYNNGSRRHNHVRINGNGHSVVVVVISVASTSSETTNNPFTPKAQLNRYWDTHISNNLPKPVFLFAKASQLDPINSTILTELAAQNSLSSNFTSFGSLANICCSFDSSIETHQQDITDKNFANCSSQLSGVDSFNDYSKK
ncbi:hypothetical protein ACFX13_041501 [Malus domestica]